MKCLLFPPFSILFYCWMEDTMGPITIIFVTQKIHDITRLSNYLLHCTLRHVKKTTSVIVIMCLQVWMQLLIGFGPIVEELKVISKEEEEEKKISTCKMLFPSISFLRALLPECVSHWLFDSIFKQPQIIYL